MDQTQYLLRIKVCTFDEPSSLSTKPQEVNREKIHQNFLLQAKESQLNPLAHLKVVQSNQV